MADCCCTLQGEFDDRTADRQLRRFRRRGPERTTRWLIDMLIEEDVRDAAVLDIGGGLGAIQLGLLDAGAAAARSVDASAAYSERAERVATERGHAGRIERRVADFTRVADSVADADVVTLDRVLCCYPDLDGLLTASAARARRLYGIVVPRDRAAIRLAVRLHNLARRLIRQDFRAYVHPARRMEDLLERLGFRPAHARDSLIWRVAVYRRV